MLKKWNLHENLKKKGKYGKISTKERSLKKYKKIKTATIFQII